MRIDLYSIPIILTFAFTLAFISFFIYHQNDFYYQSDVIHPTIKIKDEIKEKKPKEEPTKKTKEEPEKFCKHFQNHWAKEIFRECKKNNLSTPECRLLVKIAWCESRLDEKAIRRNIDGTADYGLFQLNSYWWQGWKYYSPKANIKKAIEIYKSQGTKPWKRSKRCWANRS